MPIGVITPCRYQNLSSRTRLKQLNNGRLDPSRRRKLSVIEEIINVNNDLTSPRSNKLKSYNYIINQIRSKVLKKQSKFDKGDVQKIESDDFLIKKFLKHNKDLERCSDQEIIKVSSRAIKECLAWRASSKINDLTLADFDKTVLNSLIIGKSQVCTDVHGTDILTIIYFRTDLYHKSTIKAEALSTLIAYVLEQIDRETFGNGRVRIIADCSNYNLSNLDVNLIRQVLKIAFKYYPGLVHSVDNIDAPQFRQAALDLCSRVLPSSKRSKIRFMSRQKLINELGRHNVASFLGGDNLDVIWSDEFDRCYW